MSKLLKLGFLGGGKMAQAMANGFISAGELYINFVNYISDLLLSEVYVPSSTTQLMIRPGHHAYCFIIMCK